MPTYPLQDAISNALNSDAPQDIIDGVKSAVIAEIESLDPAAAIKSTDYFNHSYAPDLTLTWKFGARREETRELYIRYSLSASQAAGDIDFLGKSGPIFFSLNSKNDDESNAASIREDLPRAPKSLFTNAPALDRITEEADARPAGELGSPSSPLLNLFRRNLVRGGRGLIVENTADRLEQTVTGDEETSIIQVDRFAEAVADIFDEAATVRLHRAADLVKIAMSGELTISNEGEEGENSAAISGKLDDTELRALLPFLLDRGHTINDSRFWRYLGQMITLPQLENMASLLGERDLTALAQANLTNWRAAKAVMTFNAEALEDEGYTGPKWRMHAGTLRASAGSWNIHFASDLRRGIRSREDSPLPQWEDVATHIAPFSISRVDLQGIVRRISIAVDSETNVDVLQDAVSIQGNIDDRFFVRQVEVRPSAENSSNINVDFSTLTATGSTIPIDDLTRVSLGVLGYRYPTTTQELNGLLR